MKTFKEYLHEAQGLEKLKRKFIPGYGKRKALARSIEIDSEIKGKPNTQKVLSKAHGADRLRNISRRID